MLGVPNERARAIYTRHGATLWHATCHTPQCGTTLCRATIFVERHSSCGMTKQLMWQLGARRLQ